MPIYEYECKSCNQRFEVFQLPGEDGMKVFCPRCHGENIVKVISLFSAGSEKSPSSGCKPSGPTWGV